MRYRTNNLRILKLKKLINNKRLIAFVLGFAILGSILLLISKAQDTNEEKWYALPIRSHEQWDKYSKGDASQIGGEGMQYPRSMVRSKSDPNVIYMAQDVGAIWKSTDGGTTWNHTIGKGLNNDYMHSVAVDPINPKKVFALTSGGFDASLRSKEGLYMSLNGGDDWSRSLAVGVDNKARATWVFGSREHQENIAYDPTSVDSKKGAKVWYAAIDCGYGTGSDKDCYLYKSEDYGTNWSKIESAYLGGHGEIHNLVVNPSNGQVLFSSSNGLYKSSNRGANFTKVSDGIPSGDVGWVALDPKKPNKVYATAVNKGLYVSDDAGARYTLQKSHDKAMSVFVNSSNPNTIYLLSSSSSNITEVSNDGGSTWSKANTPSLGYLHDYWPRKFADDKSAVLPDPRDPNKAIAHYNALIFKTVDGGKNWSLSSNLFNGHGCNKYPSSINFDPKDSNTFGFFCHDFGMTYTTNSGGSFNIGRMSDSFVQTNQVENKHIFAGSIKPGSGGRDIVASGGDKKKLIRSTDGGKNWSIIDFNYASVEFVRHHPTDGQTVYAGRWISRDGGNSFQFKKIDPNSTLVTIVDSSKDGNSLLATELLSAKNIWRSKDKGNSWEKVASFDYEINDPGRYPMVVLHPTDNNIFYFRDSKGDISKYDIAANKSYSLKLKASNSSINTPDNRVNSIVVDPTRPEVIYVHTSVPGIENVWRSVNGGSSWESISKNLPRITKYRLAVNPHTGDLFVGSMIGNWVYPRPTQYASSYSKPSITSTNKVAGYNKIPSVPPPTTNESESFTVAAAGDIGHPTDKKRQESTADLIERINPTYVIALGDLAYYNGRLHEFRENYAPFWGRQKILDKTKPVLGNHEYLDVEKVNDTIGYFNYFDPYNTGKFGARDKGYYSFTKDNWLFLNINSNCSKIFEGCNDGSTQARWVDQQLASNPDKCVVASWHHPRVSSGKYKDSEVIKDMWNKIAARKGLVLSAHNHSYARTVPLGLDAQSKSEGIRQFIVGTGGGKLYGEAYSDSRIAKVINTDLGVLKLTLTANGYRYQFINVNNAVLDEGQETLNCTAGQPTNTKPSAPTNLTSFNVTQTGLSLNWTAGAGGTATAGYEVYRNGTKISNLATTHFNDTNLTAGTMYSYYVIAYDAAGNKSSPSPTIQVATSQPTSSKTADLNNDTKIDILDLSILLTNWDPSATKPKTLADLNNDDKVDIIDMSILLSKWGK